MTGKKRTRTGQVKPSGTIAHLRKDIPITDPKPQCTQPQLPSSKPSEPQSHPRAEASPSAHSQHNQELNSPPAQSQEPSKRTRRALARTQKHHKLPKLPPHAKITRRPLLHPALPTPYTSSSSPKILYIKTSTPFIPALKRIRSLLQHISTRSKKSSAAKARRNGGLRGADVERDIVEDAKSNGGGKRSVVGEKVFLKASGRAIPRALELAVQVQEEGVVVRVEMGSVKAVDDVDVCGEGEQEEGADDVPETRVRMVSCVTVSIEFV